MRIYSNFGLILKLKIFRRQGIPAIFIFWESKDMGSKLSFIWLITISHDYDVINRQFIEGTQNTKFGVFSNSRWFLTKWSFYHQYNAKMQATFLLMSLKKYRIVRKLPLRFLRNSGSLSNNERFLESFLAKNV